MSKPSPHQKKVLLAILMLERAHGWKWWSASDIGQVVAAGGFHNTIQDVTLYAMRQAGLIWRQCDTWTQAMIDESPCCCSIHKFGLTADGRMLASSIKFQATEKAAEAIVRCGHNGGGHLHAQMVNEQRNRQRRMRRADDAEED